MNNLEAGIQQRLKKFAYEQTIPFCYLCYSDAPSGRCPSCLSDDLMRHLPSHGVEYGSEWVIRALIHENLEPINLDEAFEESVRQCYDETVKIGWIEYDTAQALRELDPASWELACSEWADSEESEGQIVSFDHGSPYFWTHDIERFLNREDAGDGAYPGSVSVEKPVVM